MTKAENLLHQEKQQKNISIQSIALGVGILLLLIKFVAYFLTHSNAILTDALESIINVVAGSVALMSLIFAALPKDRNHPYGHGKVEFLSAGFEGMLIIIAGLSIIVKSIYNLYYPNDLQALDIGIALTALAGFINYFLGIMMIRQGEKSHSMTLVAGGEHLKSDAYSTVGLVLGLGLIFLTNWFWIDNVIAVLFGTLIAITGGQIIRKAIAGIMDETDDLLLEEMLEHINKYRKDDWIDIHNLRVIKYGSALHIDCHLTLPWYWNLQESHDEVHAFEEMLKMGTEKELEIFIHTDPCLSESCKLCLKKDCKIRQFNFEEKVDWTLDNVLLNKKHKIKK
ncbi:MAG: cation diffusion facilitator family transporter [Chitinophagales bacterium]